MFWIRLLLMVATLGGVARAEGLAPGTMLDASNAAQAEKLLPPEIFKHYQNGEYMNPIVDWPVSKYTWPVDFVAATKANTDKFKIAPEGHVVDKATGQQPANILGFPFPTIDEKDPTAGSQIIWNCLYRTWYMGNLQAESQINMVNRKGLERRLDVTANFMYFDGVPKDELPTNSGNFLVKFLTVVRNPADVNGTAALTWRYRDPAKRDSSWAFVPALRRVRAVSPANRSDGFLGSDLSQDDGGFFEGKPEDFNWKLTGETDQLRIVDPINLEGKSRTDWYTKGGGWNAMWNDLPFIGYMDPQWKGIGWAPRTAALANRRFWVLEATPKDRYYLFGKMQMFIDKVAFQGAWNRKFDWKGEILNTYQVLAYNPHEIKRPDGRVDYVNGSNMAYQTAEAVKSDRATVAGIKSAPDSLFLLRGKFDEAVFDLDRLSQSSK